MPAFPIVDSHVHLWDPTKLTYAWLNDEPQLNKPFGLAEYRQTCGDAQVERFVFVQCECNDSISEATWVASLAAKDERLQAIVAQAPLEQGAAVRDHLEELTDIKLVRGIRRLIQSEPDNEFCLQPKFVEGVRLLHAFNYSFDICIFHPQLASTIQLVRQCPDVKFILDHVGKPDIKHQKFDPWKADIKELASLPNVWCKISGLVTEADLENWQPAEIHPYIDHVIACFGFDRIMFGGDWPVITLTCELSRWIDILSQQVAEYSQAEQQKLFHDNAVSFYRLPS